MYKNPLTKGRIEENSVGIGEISNEMVQERASELALIAGHRVSEEYLEQARRELTGGSEKDASQEMLEMATEDERWDPVTGGFRHQIVNSNSLEEDDDGRSESAQLFEEGVYEAEHDQMLQAAKAQRQKYMYD